MITKEILGKCFDEDYPEKLTEDGDSEFVGGIYDVYKKAFERAFKVKNDDIRLDLANAQFLGYFSGKWGDLIGMIKAMDLTKKEWEILKNDYELNFDEIEFDEIENYLTE